MAGQDHEAAGGRQGGDENAVRGPAARAMVAVKRNLDGVLPLVAGIHLFRRWSNMHHRSKPEAASNCSRKIMNAAFTGPPSPSVPMHR